MPSQIANLRPGIEVDGQPLPDTLGDDLQSVIVDRELNLPGRAVLTFLDPDHVHADAAVFDIGKAVDVFASSASAESRRVRIFHGTVSGASVRRFAGGTAAFRVTVDDPTVALGRVVRPKVMNKYTAAQAIEDALGPSGLAHSVDSTSQTFDYLAQTVTAQYLVDEMCARAGLVWWFDPVTKRFLAKAYQGLVTSGANAVTLGEEDDLDEYELSASSLHDGSANARGWDDKTKVSAVGSAQPGSAGSDTPFALKFLDKTAAKAAGGPSSGTTVLRTDTTTQGLTAIAAATLATQLRRSVVAHVTVGIAPSIGPATVVTIGIAPKPLRGKYFVTRVVHEFDGDSFTTRFSTADFGAPMFSGAGTAGSHAFDVPVLQTAVVTNLNDPEKRGRVKVRFPSLDDALESTWARVAIVGGGQNRGLVWLPEIDDEVVVGFENGDVRRPVVLGCLINGKDQFPADTTTDGKHDVRRITTKAGNVVEFGDAQGKERILLSVPAGKTTVEVSATGVTVDSADHPLTLKNGQGASIVLDAQGGVTIKGKQVTVQSDAGGAVTVKASGKLAASGATAEVTSSGSTTVKGSVAEVSASGPLTLKGAMVKVN